MPICPFAHVSARECERYRGRARNCARDRESFSDPWRRVLLKKVSKSTWVLLDENGKALDEPDCPCACRMLINIKQAPPTLIRTEASSHEDA